MTQQQEAGKLRVAKLLDTFGCVPAINDLTTLEEWNAQRLAAAIEEEIKKAAAYGFTKITLHMDVPDAARLAKVLRTRPE